MSTAVSVAALALSAILVGCTSTVPRPAPHVELPSDADRAAAYRLLVGQETDQLTSMHPGVAVPQVEIVRYVTPEEWAPAMAECMTSEGFKVTAHQDGGIRAAEVAAGQQEAQAVAYFTCALSYPLDPKFTMPLDREQQRYVFDYYVNELIPCLEGRGYPISDPPSWQVFEEDFFSSPWSPYSQVNPLTSEGEWNELNQACPQQPEHLFG